MSNDNVVPLQALDPAGFRVPASDAKGHSVRKYVRVMPMMAHMIDVILSSRQFPYKTEAELIRHAIMRHINWLESIGGIESVSGVVEAASAVLKEDQMYEEYQAIFTSLRNRVHDYIDRGENQEARRLVTEMRSHFNRMPDGYWKNRYAKQLKEWDWLFENAPKVKLTVLAND